MKSEKWLNPNKSAIMFSFDLDGETVWINAAKGLLNGEKYIKSRSMGRYGPKRGVDNILEVMEKYDAKGTFFVPALSAEHFPDVVKKIDAKGHEIAFHGYAHERFVEQSEAEQIRLIDKSQDIYYHTIGRTVTGFRAPSGDLTKDSIKLLYERGFLYSSSMRGGDEPYRTIIEGVKSDFIEIPTRWEMDDYVEMAYNMYPAEPAGQDRISCYRNVLENFTIEEEAVHRMGLCMPTIFHPQVIGSPGRVMILESMLKQAREYGDMWIATGTEIADAYRIATTENQEVQDVK